MPDRSNYWTRRLGQGRYSRRRFVGGAATGGMGAAGLALVGCGDDDDDGGNGNGGNGDPTATPSNGNGNGDPTATPSNGNGNGNGGSQPKTGGVRRTISADNTYDTFDASRSRFTPFATIIGLSHQRALQWAQFQPEPVLEGGLAEDWEQPDPTQVTLFLRSGATYHDKPPVNGRAATPEDIQYHIERNKAGVLTDGTEDPNFYRKQDYQVVDSIEVVDESTITITLSRPDPFFLQLLASSYEAIQAPEAIEEFEGQFSNFSSDLVIGTGPYVMTEFTPEGGSTFRRHENFAGPRAEDTFLDGFVYVPLFTDPTAQENAFRQKQIDIYSPSTVPVLDELRNSLGDQIVDSPGFSANPIAGTYYGGAPPWSDQNLIGAIFRAWDRRQLIEQFHGGRGALSGNIPPTQNAFRMPESELVTYPGYLEDREQEITEARQMWEAGGGPGLGTITLDVPDIFHGLYDASSILVNMLNENLGTDQFEASVETYSTITGKIIQQQYGNGNNNIWYGWITELTNPEPSSNIVQNFNSESPLFEQFGVQIDEVDELTNELAVELDLERRIELTQQIDRLLVENYGAGVPNSHVQITNELTWTYYHRGYERAPFSEAHITATHSWIDPDDPTYEGRPDDPDL